MNTRLLLFGLCAPIFMLHAEQPSLKVGFIAPLTGPAGAYGTAVKNGIDMFQREHPESRVEWVFEDDQFVSAKTVNAFRKLVDVNKVAAVVSIGSGPTAAIAPLAEAQGVPLIGWASDEGVSKDRTWVIRSFTSGRNEGKRGAEEALRRGYQKTGVVISTNDYAHSVREGFRESFPKERLLLSEEFLPEEKDYRALIGKMKTRGLDSVYLCLNAGPLSIFAKQAKQAGLKAHLCGCEHLHSMEEVRASDGALVGAWFVAGYASPQFEKRYVELFHNDTLLSGAAIHYDIASLLADFAASGKSQKELMAWLLALGPREGMMGPYQVKKEHGDQFFDLILVVKEVMPNGFREVKQGA